jgi:hypothetical protein
MLFFFSLIPATLPLVLGYFLYFSATKAQGGVQLFGRILAVWMFVLAAFFPLAGAYATIADLAPLDAVVQEMKSMHSRVCPT